MAVLVCRATTACPATIGAVRNTIQVSVESCSYTVSPLHGGTVAMRSVILSAASETDKVL